MNNNNSCLIIRPIGLRLLDMFVFILFILCICLTGLIKSYHYHTLVVLFRLSNHNIKHIIIFHEKILQSLVCTIIIDVILSFTWIVSFICQFKIIGTINMENIIVNNNRNNNNNNRNSSNDNNNDNNDAINNENNFSIQEKVNNKQNSNDNIDNSNTIINRSRYNNSNNNSNNIKMSIKNPVIIDIGSLYTRAGFAGSSMPECVLSSHEYWSGHSSMWKQGLCEGNHVRDSNKATVSWDDVEKMFNTIYEEELSISSSEQPLLLSWCPSFSEKDVETAAEMAFESLHVPAIYLGQVPILSLYGNGHTTGVSFHSGERLTHACAIYEGYAMSDSLFMSNRAGSSVTRKLARLLLDKKDKKIDLKLLSESTWETLRIHKSRLLKAAISNDSVSTSNSHVSDLIDDSTILLPDGMVVKLAEEDRDLCAEQLFNDTKNLSSKSIDSYDSSMQSLVVNCIASTESNIHKSLWGNIILSGGNTKLNGFKQRLVNDLQPLSADNKVDVKQKKNVDSSIWLGGSVLASSDNFNQHWVTKGMYHEKGVDVITKHCQLIKKK